MAKLGSDADALQFHIRPEDHVIAVMGVTGAGKSTFVSLFTDVYVGIGHNLVSHTSVVQAYKCSYKQDQDLYLIDTPGFNDTFKSDTDVLREVATWLARAYKSRVRLTGIVYLHRINETRFTGSAVKNLDMFKLLCGPDYFSQIALATTCWNKKDLVLFESREKELRTDPSIWGLMCQRRSTVWRQDDGLSSALAIVDHLVSQSDKASLKIQRELVDDACLLEETGAGRRVTQETEQQRRKYQRQLEQMIREYQQNRDKLDTESRQKLERSRAEAAAKIERIVADRRKLSSDYAELQRQMMVDLDSERQNLEHQLRDKTNQIAFKEQEMKLFESQYQTKQQQEEELHQLSLLRLDVERLKWQQRPWYEKLFDGTVFE